MRMTPAEYNASRRVPRHLRKTKTERMAGRRQWLSANVARQVARKPSEGSPHPLSRLAYDFAEIMTGWADASDGGGDRGALDRFTNSLFRNTHWA